MLAAWRTALLRRFLTTRRSWSASPLRWAAETAEVSICIPTGPVVAELREDDVVEIGWLMLPWMLMFVGPCEEQQIVEQVLQRDRFAENVALVVGRVRQVGLVDVDFDFGSDAGEWRSQFV